MLELCMRPFGDNRPGVKDDEAIGPRQRSEPVRDQDHRHVLKACDRFEERVFGCQI